MTRHAVVLPAAVHNKTRERSLLLQGHSDVVNGIGWSPDALHLASGLLTA